MRFSGRREYGIRGTRRSVESADDGGDATVNRLPQVTAAPDDLDPDSPEFRYDEMAFFAENCAEHGIDWSGRAEVERVEHRLADGRTVSALRWGSGPPRTVFVHGGAQNAHTWDTVVLSLGQPSCLAIDLPGHGRSAFRTDGGYSPRTNAADLCEALDAWCDEPVLLVGMSLGGLTSNAIGSSRPDLVRSLVVVDVTPGVNRDKARDVIDFIAGPQTFGSFGEIFARTVEFNPTRSAASLRRGILHNAHREPDGSWAWNYDRQTMTTERVLESAVLWDDVSATTGPYLLVRGSVSPVVDDDDVAELVRRRPDAEVVVVDGAGHSVQGDRPLELAAMLVAR